MKKIICILSCFLFLNACITEEENRYIVSYKNESGVTLTIHRFNGTVENTRKLLDREDYVVDNYIRHSLIGDASADSLTIVFPNGKGYACDFRANDSGEELCFDDGRYPLGGVGFTDAGNYRFQFIITQEDFLNAKDLD